MLGGIDPGYGRVKFFLFDKKLKLVLPLLKFVPRFLAAREESSGLRLSHQLHRYNWVSEFVGDVFAASVRPLLKSINSMFSHCREGACDE